MQTFLEETIKDLKSQYSDLSSLTLILPSKRAGGFLKDHLKKSATTTGFAPIILSIEEFLETLSNLTQIDATELLFKSYEAYVKNNPENEKEDFESYAIWANTLLNDFNEIDRYLVEPKTFFSYLGSIKSLEKWNVEKEKTQLIENYLRFWDSLYGFYNQLQDLLLSESVGYQGMLYRQAALGVLDYTAVNGDRPHIFIGFNALNYAEQKIIKTLLDTGNSNIYWDTDAYFQEDTTHSASLFIRRYLKEWKHFENKTLNEFPNNFSKNKHLQFIAVQKNIGQAKYISKILSGFTDAQLKNTAIVLADENLLIPVLYSLPENVKSVNVTMGANLKNFPSVLFFDMLLSFHLNWQASFYYKDIISLLKHPIANLLIPETDAIVSKINSENRTHFSLEFVLEHISVSSAEITRVLLGDWKNDGMHALKVCSETVLALKDAISENEIQRVVLFELYKLFEEVKALHQKFPHITGVKTVQRLYSEMTSMATVDFEGEAYGGLQIMGILETRVLDFENIIMTSVNEGIIPSGKSNTSFITYDLKKEFGLPSYFEKDAIYTYHFYRLLQRAENVYLLYNNHSEGLNAGEKSRFLLQMEIDNLPNHKIEKIAIAPKIEMEPHTPKTIEKTEAVMVRLKEIAGKGFSPSALTSYIRNPLDFYFQKILRLSEFEEIEETVAANTLGTIVHDTLEVFYKPFEGEMLTSEKLTILKTHISEEVTLQFQKTFKGGSFNKGKNLIIFEVAKRYVSNLIDLDLSEIKAGNEIKILKIEEKMTINIDIPELDFPVDLGGKVDRVDSYNGQVRIIDYKTGKVEQRQLSIVDWEEITHDYKFSKAFQVLAYATMMREDAQYDEIEAGIISFKNMGGRFLKFAIKENGSRNKNHIINDEIVNEYMTRLKILILEICNAEIPFTEKIV